jgi:hypothetical protein
MKLPSILGILLAAFVTCGFFLVWSLQERCPGIIEGGLLCLDAHGKLELAHIASPHFSCCDKGKAT